MKMKRALSIIVSVLIFLISGTAAASVHGEHIHFHFRFDKTAVDTTYMSNRDSYIRLIESISKPIQSVEIRVVSSPEGSERRNSYLAEQRAQAITDFVIESSHGKIGMDDIRITVTAENWEGLLEAVTENYHRHDRIKVLEIISTEGISDATREWRLGRLDNGYTWNYIKRKYCPQLRQACIVGIQYKEFEPLPNIDIDFKNEVGTSHSRTLDISLTEPRTSTQPKIKPDADFNFGISTNTLLDLAMTPNIGIELYTDNGWAAGASWSHAWWSREASHKFWRIFGGELDIRKYLGTHSKTAIPAGHHIGIYGQGYSYDFESGGRGMMSRFTYGVGVEYGYTLPICNSLNVDFALGFGYLGGEYMLYDPEDGCYVWKETRIRHLTGPTKAEISLIWIPDINLFRKKRGRR